MKATKSNGPCVYACGPFAFWRVRALFGAFVIVWMGCDPANEVHDPLRLPMNVVPTSYSLLLKVDPRSAEFEGDVSIDVKVRSRTRVIELHALGLQMKRVTVRDHRGETIGARWEPLAKDGRGRVVLKRDVDPGRAVLRFVYKAPFGTVPKGMYRVTEEDAWYAFAALDGGATRRVVPCFDEPRFRTPFEIALTVPQEFRAFSNTPVHETQQQKKGESLFRFAKTKPLPTYLIGWAVGAFDEVKGASVGPNKIRKHVLELNAIACRGHGNELRFAMEQVPRILNELEEYFEIAYPFEKITLVAAPHYSSGGMETPGLLTFQSHLLLIDEDSTEENRKSIVYYLAHEFGHMWFGNLVSIQWWDDAWLKEGFATWLSQRTVAKLYAEFEGDLAEFRSTQSSLREDRDAELPLRPRIQNADDIERVFGDTTYFKGAAVIRSLERWVGTTKFRKALQVFLRKYSWKSATGRQFFDVLDEVAQKKARDAFTDLFVTTGAPTVATVASCENNVSLIAMEQVFSRQSPWHRVPMCIRYSDANGVGEQCTVVEDKPVRVVLSTKGCSKWVMPNAGGTGYYFWRPTREMIENLLKFGSGELSRVERAAVEKKAKEIPQLINLIQPPQ